MTFTSLKEILDEAKHEKYGVGAFNIHNLETAMAISEAAKCEESPVIFAVSPAAIRYSGIDYIHQIARIAAMESKMPTVLHLDHGTSFEECMQCIRHGWSSVMFDGSNLSLTENILRTKEIVKAAHAVGVSVEAELGKVAGIEEYISISKKDEFTDPDKALKFVSETEVDALAIAIGTSHGAYKFKGPANLDFERLKEIERLINIPIVLHGASGIPKEVINRATKYGAKLPGASGIPDEDIKKAIDLGVAKINISTDIKMVVTAALRQELIEHPEEFDPIKIFVPVTSAVKKIAIQKMRLFGSSGKAKI